jgi:hypothetical protein
MESRLQGGPSRENSPRYWGVRLGGIAGVVPQQFASGTESASASRLLVDRRSDLRKRRAVIRPRSGINGATNAAHQRAGALGYSYTSAHKVLPSGGRNLMALAALTEPRRSLVGQTKAATRLPNAFSMRQIAASCAKGGRQFPPA